jgi:DNA adenine methylase
MQQAEPIIPWLGGKRRLADRLIPLFPQHECYVELFCGGAALFFLKPGVARAEVLNDVNGELVNLYRVVQHHLEEFVRQFKWALTSRTVFKWLQAAPTEPMTDIQRAARFFYLQHHAFGGKVAGQTFGTATTAPAFNFCRIEEQLSAAHLRLAGAYIENLAWHECLERYDRPHTFFFADPPYWETEGYGVAFGWDQYERLAHAMGTCKGKVMLTLNDHPDVRELFTSAGFRVLDTEIKYSVANAHGAPATSRELIILNYEEAPAGSLF